MNELIISGLQVLFLGVVLIMVSRAVAAAERKPTCKGPHKWKREPDGLRCEVCLRKPNE